MASNKTIYSCSKCDSQFPKWQGKCPECNSWGTISESVSTGMAQTKRALAKSTAAPAAVVSLGSHSPANTKRVSVGISEVDRVLGGGLVDGSVYLIGGDPGIGKSTLLLQLADSIKKKVLYVSGEESVDQVKGRVDRLGLTVSGMGFVAETDLPTVLSTIDAEKPDLVIIDSIQTIRDSNLEQEAGSVTQIKAVTAQLVEWAKARRVIMLIVGHVTKSGSVAGPKTLEHLVDGVLYVEGDQHQQYRILRSTKNRFGSVDEIGVFTIDTTGFHPAKEPSKMFLSDVKSSVAGSVITPVVEGSRIFFVEYQALVTRSGFGYPVRKSVGFDQNRLHMLIAVLTKRLKLPLDQFDVHLNVAGGMSMQEPACDLAVCTAIISALKNIAVESSVVVFGEVGLAGEVRPVPFYEKRVSEARRLGFSRVVAPPDREHRITGVEEIRALKDVLQILG